jgi:hypothetical protein
MMVYRAANDVFSDFVDGLQADYHSNWIARLTAMYQNDNRMLAECSGLDLARFGYVL